MSWRMMPLAVSGASVCRSNRGAASELIWAPRRLRGKHIYCIYKQGTKGMTDLKHTNPKKLLWLDFELTGLNPAKDRIIEVAAIVTDWDFKELAEYQSGVRHNEQKLRDLLAQNAWMVSRPKETEALLETAMSGPSEIEVESAVLKLLDGHAEGTPVLLAGNSIHFDRMFIRQWWPRLEARLHYRMLDVSAWKVVMMGKYDMEFKKKEQHRAMDDIRESIAELKFYLDAAKFTKK